jgi:hypothetical protein
MNEILLFAYMKSSYIFYQKFPQIHDTNESCKRKKYSLKEIEMKNSCYISVLYQENPEHRKFLRKISINLLKGNSKAIKIQM